MARRTALSERCGQLVLFALQPRGLSIPWLTPLEWSDDIEARVRHCASFWAQKFGITGDDRDDVIAGSLAEVFEKVKAGKIRYRSVIDLIVKRAVISRQRKLDSQPDIVSFAEIYEEAANEFDLIDTSVTLAQMSWQTLLSLWLARKGLRPAVIAAVLGHSIESLQSALCDEVIDIMEFCVLGRA